MALAAPRDRAERCTSAPGCGCGRRCRPDRGVSGPAEEVPLAELDLERLEDRPLGFGLDPLGDDMAIGRRREVEEGDDEGLPGEIGVHAAHEADVDLHELWPELDEGIEVRDTGTGIVDREG